jgi:hypothetical protein
MEIDSQACRTDNAERHDISLLLLGMSKLAVLGGENHPE